MAGCPAQLRSTYLLVKKADTSKCLAHILRSRVSAPLG